MISLDITRLPKSRRLNIGKSFATLTQPNVQFPLSFDFSNHLPFLHFLGYWLGKGYYNQYGVVVPTGRDTVDLIPIFDYMTKTFKCNYRTYENKLIKFDSSALKYTMLGLHLDTGVKPKKEFPSWIALLSENEYREFFNGFFTGRAIVSHKMARIKIECCNDQVYQIVSSYLNKIGCGFSTTDYTTINVIDMNDLQVFSQNISFVSADKNSRLQKLLRPKKKV